MSRGGFRLAAVLRIRRVQEELARAELTTSNGRVRRALVTHDRVAERYRGVPLSSGRIPASAFLREEAAATMTAATLHHAAGRLTAARTDADAARGRWQEAARRVEALERLETRVNEEARAEELRREGSAVDEMVTARFVAADRAGATDGGPR
jgi:flagellar export protein FliJ